MNSHLTMEQLLALRDSDRSEPGMSGALEHFDRCADCQRELERLHQRTARLRALPVLSPISNEFPAVRQRITVERHQRRWRAVAVAGLTAAAALVISVIGRDLIHPQRLDAEQELQSAINRSQQLERELHAWHPDQRVMDGRTAIAVIQLEDQIANVDAQLAQTADLQQDVRNRRELALWQQRVGLMNALVEVHLTQATNVGL